MQTSAATAATNLHKSVYVLCRFWKMCRFLGKCSDFLLPDGYETLHTSLSSARGRTKEVRDVVKWNGINKFPDLSGAPWICTYFPVRLYILPKFCTNSAHFPKFCTKICTSQKSANFAKSDACEANVLPNSAHRATSEATETLFLF